MHFCIYPSNQLQVSIDILEGHAYYHSSEPRKPEDGSPRCAKWRLVQFAAVFGLFVREDGRSESLKNVQQHVRSIVRSLSDSI